jgi:hypothetical protein
LQSEFNIGPTDIQSFGGLKRLIKEFTENMWVDPENIPVIPRDTRWCATRQHMIGWYNRDTQVNRPAIPRDTRWIDPWYQEIPGE